MFSLSNARKCAVESIRGAQQRYKRYHDRHATPFKYRVGSWVFIRFSLGDNANSLDPGMGHIELSQCICAAKVYFPEDGVIRVHQSRVKPCPKGFPAGSYLYKGRKSRGSVPSWVLRYLEDCSPQVF